MIKNAIKFSNGIVMVFNEKGEQMPKYQGRYEEVKAKILAHAPKSAEFFHGVWKLSSKAIQREQW